MYYVYRFLDYDNRVLYVGYTKNIEKRVKVDHIINNYIRGDIKSINKVEFSTFDNKCEALYNEAYYINLYKPKFNKKAEPLRGKFNVKNNWCEYLNKEEIQKIINSKNKKAKRKLNRIEKKIKAMLIERDKNLSWLAKQLNTSQQNLGSKMRRNNLYSRDIEEIAEALGYELKIEFVKK